MTSVWKQMSLDRTQVALESILLKRFCAPDATLERRIIQTPSFRRNVLNVWAQHCISKDVRHTISSISELARAKVPKDCDEDSKWLIQKLADTTATEPRSRFPKELSLTGPRFPFEPKDLAYLQKKTDTLTGRELSRPITVEGKSHTASAGSGRGARRRDRESLREYGWRIEADDDNLNEDILAPKHSSF